MKAEFDWGDETIGNINARLGVEEEMDGDGVGEIEGEQNDNNEDDCGKTGKNIEKVGGKVVQGIIKKSKEDDDDDKGPPKHNSNGEKNRMYISELGR